MKKLIVALLILGILPICGWAGTCVDAGCHQDLIRFSHPHPPVADDCTSCHEQTGDHEFTLMAEGKELCYACHDSMEKGKLVHAALEMGPCTQCHSPHGSNVAHLLKADRVDTLCYECHDRPAETAKFQHGPAYLGNCSLCHIPHSGDQPHLLTSAPDTLCVTCHTGKSYTAAGQHRHSALDGGCTGCHDAHASAFRYQLLAAPAELCAQCHDTIAEKARTAAHPHPATTQQKACLNCHDPHGSTQSANLVRPALDLCLGCHNHPLVGTDGKDYNITTIVTTGKYKHGPVETGECAACHDPHGSAHAMILTAAFPVPFYTAYSADKYALCFQCHDQALAESATTTDATGFRNGTQNLHYVHVHREKGRTCRACHQIHAGDQPRHIRRETPFGQWDIPIGYEALSDGGRCSPGCHQPYSYSTRTGEVQSQ